MFKFLRFEIGGLAAILWAGLILSPITNFQSLLSAQFSDLLLGVFGSIVLSLPLGNYVHQIADTFFSPYLATRARFFKRYSSVRAKSLYQEECKFLRDDTYQLLHVLSQSINVSFPSELESNGEPANVTLDIGNMREAVRSRYSYFYARIEGGLVSPIIGLLLSGIVLSFAEDGSGLFASTNYSVWYIFLFWIFLAIAMLWRIPQLFREIDDLESALLTINRKFIESLGVGA